MWGFQQQSPAPKESDDPAVDDDLCGKPASIVSNPDIPGSLAALQNELSKIPATEKAALAHAQGLNPELFDDDHILQFLYSEKFNAAVRVCDVHVIFWFSFCPLTNINPLLSTHTSKHRPITARCQETCSILE
jgi:hypothetical protein